MKKSLGALTVAFALLSGACGADATVEIADNEARSNGVLADALDAVSGDPVEDEAPDPVADAVAAAEEAVEVEPASTAVAEPTAVPTPEPVVANIEDLPGLLTDLDAAVGNSAVPPMEIAQRLIGFPFNIATTRDASLLNAAARLSYVFEGEVGWDFDVRTLAGAPVADVDIRNDDYGPGSVEVTNFYDPLMAELGFTRSGSTGSDPGDEGGPHSVNHVYRHESREQVVNGIPGEIPNVKIWLDEDMLGAAYNEDYEQVPGYRYEFDFDTIEGAGVPVPMLASILDAVPVPDGARLVEADLRTKSRDEDSFGINRGRNYVDVEFQWEMPEGTDFDAVLAYFVDPATYADPDIFINGEEGFNLTEGQIVPTELSEYNNGQRMQLLTLLVQQYVGLYNIERAEGDEPIKIRLEIEMNPNDMKITG